MSWPMSQDYNEAIQSPTSCFADDDLKQGEVVTNPMGIPLPCSGNFADVYAIQTPKRKWAVKCFTRQIPGLKERYVEISKYLAQVPLRFMVDFKFLEEGVRIRGQWYPAIKMHWVEGMAFNTFVGAKVDKPKTLEALCQIWMKLAARLRDAQIGHCDLQHGNVLLVPQGNNLGVKLVDYDGMCVPALELLKPIEVGHPNFQHPQRIREGKYGVAVDRFSHLVIYTALRSLAQGGSALWQRYDNGDNLLFKRSDFESPASSRLLQELAQSSDEQTRNLAHAVADAAQKPLEETPLIEAVMSGKSTTATVGADPFGSIAAPSTYRRKKRSPLAMITIAALLVVGVVGAGIWLTSNGGNGEGKDAHAQKDEKNNNHKDGSKKITRGLPNMDHLVGWWPGDGHTFDLSGKNHGKSQNGASFGPGRIGQGFRFNGKKQFISIPDSLTLRPKSFTVGGWFYLAKRPPEKQQFMPLAKYGGYQGWLFRIGSNLQPGITLHRLPKSGKTIGASSKFALNTWVHIIAAYDGTNCRLYLNGKLSNTAKFPNYTPSAVPMTIGAWSGSHGWPGLVDEVVFFDRALTASEIQALANEKLKKKKN